MQTVRGVFKTSRSALDDRIGGPVADERPIVMWMARQAACLYNRPNAMRTHGRQGVRNDSGRVQ